MNTSGVKQKSDDLEVLQESIENKEGVPCSREGEIHLPKRTLLLADSEAGPVSRTPPAEMKGSPSDPLEDSKLSTSSVSEKANYLLLKSPPPPLSYILQDC